MEPFSKNKPRFQVLKSSAVDLATLVVIGNHQTRNRANRAIASEVPYLSVHDDIPKDRERRKAKSDALQGIKPPSPGLTRPELTYQTPSSGPVWMGFLVWTINS